ncbi:MAG: DUF3105 domain-containing protein [Actinomycetota bacterium]|jgi:hypothetical protein|nr:DUF3105 domain-containing protein [Actinomycetota bacterium]
MVRTKLLTVGVMLLVTLLAAAPTFAQAPLEGLESFEVPSRFHTEEPVFYQQNPPAGGDHAPVWQNCGFYDAPVRNENAVHSLEHGVVWITYRPDLPPEQIETLRMLANNHSHVLVSPYPDLPTPVVGSAWGRQLRLEGANDPRLEQFVSTFEWGSQSPEPEGPCTGGIGEPVVASGQ